MKRNKYLELLVSSGNGALLGLVYFVWWQWMLGIFIISLFVGSIISGSASLLLFKGYEN